jgi:hypothetical protein
MRWAFGLIQRTTTEGRTVDHESTSDGSHARRGASSPQRSIRTDMRPPDAYAVRAAKRLAVFVADATSR